MANQQKAALQTIRLKHNARQASPGDSQAIASQNPAEAMKTFMKTAIAEHERRRQNPRGTERPAPEHTGCGQQRPSSLRTQAGPPRSPAEAARAHSKPAPRRADAGPAGGADRQDVEQARNGPTPRRELRAQARRATTRPAVPGIAIASPVPTAEGRQGQGPQRRWPGPVTDAQQRPSTPRVYLPQGLSNPSEPIDGLSMFPVHLYRPPSILALPSNPMPGLPILPAFPNRRPPLFARRSKPPRAQQTLPAPKPARKKTTTSGGKGGPFTTSAIAEDYLKLCRDPFSDLQRWIDEDKKTGNRVLPPPATDNAMIHTPHEPQPQSNFCVKHCMKCQAGWTRSTSLGVTVVICLLNREPVLANITACNKFKPIEI